MNVPPLLGMRMVWSINRERPYVLNLVPSGPQEMEARPLAGFFRFSPFLWIDIPP